MRENDTIIHTEISFLKRIGSLLYLHNELPSAEAMVKSEQMLHLTHAFCYVTLLLVGLYRLGWGLLFRRLVALWRRKLLLWQLLRWWWWWLESWLLLSTRLKPWGDLPRARTANTVRCTTSSSFRNSSLNILTQNIWGKLFVCENICNIYFSFVTYLCKFDSKSNSPFPLKLFVKTCAFISGLTHHTVLSFLNFPNHTVIPMNQIQHLLKDMGLEQGFFLLNATFYPYFHTHYIEHKNFPLYHDPSTTRHVLTHFTLIISTKCCQMHTTTSNHQQKTETKIPAFW